MVLLNKINLNWTEKYRPKNLNNIVSNKESVINLKKFILEKKPTILYGPAGTGKTSSVHVLANELNYEILEINASDQRNKDKIIEIIGSSSKQLSLFNSGKIILIDEVDGIAGNEDRGGIAALNQIIKETKHSIILTANDPYSKKLAELRKKCCLVEFKPISLEDTYVTLKNILEKENVLYDESTLRKLARKSNGDLRAGVNDLQTLTQGRKELTGVDIIEEREKEETIFNALRTVFKSKDVNLILESFENTSVDLDECFLWLDENLPVEYKKPLDIKRGYEALSRADIYKKRIFREQYYRLLVYRNALMTAGIAFSKKESYLGFTPYKRTTRLLKIYIQNQKNAKKIAIAEKLAEYTHCSIKKTLQNNFNILKTLIKKNINPKELRLTEEEIEYIKRL